MSRATSGQCRMDFSKSASHASRAIALSAIIICFFFSLLGNELGEVWGKAVGEALRVNTVLQTLNLLGNELGEVWGKAVG